jgi:sugar lactone lactonase YvrE
MLSESSNEFQKAQKSQKAQKRIMRRTIIPGLLALLLSDPALSQFDAGDRWQVEKIADGFVFTEGPVWDGDKLFFSDLRDNKIYTWSEENGVEKFLDPSGNTNGMAVDAEGRLIMAQQEFRRMSRMEADSSIVPLATHFEGKRLNIPNDVAYKSDGSIFFTDPPIGIEEKDRELDFAGIFRIGNNGELYLLDKTVKQPNGITFSRDESRLFVTDSNDKEVYTWDVEDTVITHRRLFATIQGFGYIDGMTTDDKGRLFVAGPTGVWVFEEDGSLVETIPVALQLSNCCWGGKAEHDLFVTAGTELYRVNELTMGVGTGRMDARAPLQMELYSSHPNPFFTGTQIPFQLSAPSHVMLTVHTSSGEIVCTLIDKTLATGYYTADWNAEGLAPGVYHVVLEIGSGILTEKCVLLHK